MPDFIDHFFAAFPITGPYRADQVVSNPISMALLFLLQLVLAGLIHHAGSTDRRRAAGFLSVLLLTTIFLFFLLASWGVGDVNKLSYQMVAEPFFYGWREPFWTLLSPLVAFLPYRFTTVHALVCTAYAASGMVLASKLRVMGWSGWWSLLIVCSPFLRGYLQAGITRQALAVLVLLPLMLWAAGVVRVSGQRLLVGALFSASLHSSFPANLAAATGPLLIQVRRLGQGFQLVASSLTKVFQLIQLLAYPLIALLLWGGWFYMPMLHQKFLDYVGGQTYFPNFLIRPEVFRLQFTLLMSLLIVCWQLRKGPVSFWSSSLARSLTLYAGLHLLGQLSIAYGWLPQLTSRFQDAFGFYLLILFLAWLVHSSRPELSVLPLVVTLQYWLMDRIAISGLLPCGLNDEFLCIPDRWPWQVNYW